MMCQEKGQNGLWKNNFARDSPPLECIFWKKTESKPTNGLCQVKKEINRGQKKEVTTWVATGSRQKN